MLGKSSGRGSDSGYCENQFSDGKQPRICDGDLITPVSSPVSQTVLPVDNCAEGLEATPKRSRVGSSCAALRHAVAALNRLDDFTCEKIGSGFFSEVFKVTHRTTGQVMVLKMNLLRSNRPNMLKEVQLMNKLSHPNILGFMGVCVHEGQLHALTEYINGGSLEQLILNPSIDLSHLTKMKLALDIARGMEYLHSRGVFHRDLTSKNVLIRKNEETGEMIAVVGDFGLAAKIPDPLCKYRLPTVGSPYWMSPECLKGQWYNEKSDVFSYGIVLCEMIARIEADPDILPRTENFGLDYLAFSEMCGSCPPEFLKLAFSCCTFEPKSRPSFSDIVIRLEKIIKDYETALELSQKQQQLQQLQQQQQQDSLSSLPIEKLLLSALEDRTGSITGVLARSEEVIPTASVAASENTEATRQRKLSHRRSLSEDVGCIVFPPHTAPSDKARCHFMSTRQNLTIGGDGDAPLVTAKHVGESMCKQDPHYKPMQGDKTVRANPFAALSQFRGVKKIVGGINKGGSPNAYVCGQGGDLFSSCFELPSPFYGPTPPSTPTTEIVDGVIDILSPDNTSLSYVKSEWQNYVEEKRSLSPLCGSTSSNLPKLNQPLSLPASPTLMRRRLLTNFVHSPTQNISPINNDIDEIIPKKPSTSEDGNNNSHSNHKPFVKRREVIASSLYTHPLFSAKLEQEQKNNSPSNGTNGPGIQHQTLHPHPLLINQRVCSSSLNLADPGLLLSEDPRGGLGLPSSALRRRGSCESGFFSSVGEDFTVTAGDLLLPSDFGGINTNRNHHNASSATLSSSSAASSLFLLDDSAISTTTVSSLRSGSGELGELDDLGGAGASGVMTRSTPHHHSLLFSAKRSSSIYTDSSEDISSLGGGDLSYWEDRSFSGIGSQPRQISKIVEYFERKQQSTVGSRLSESTENGTSVWDIPESPVSSKHQRDTMFHQAGCANRSSPVDFARRMEGASLNDAIRSSKIALLRKSLEKVTTTPQQAAAQAQGSVFSSSLQSERLSICPKRNVNATQRLMICEGAVRSKLPLFDKK
ncbi:uncharacterized protein cdi [Anabrus simplex]|uniref:uncharacterized protein cdi n=1 Tax=Anabrus simplex TaxID=316456 RepID=UPI0034DD2CC6